MAKIERFEDIAAWQKTRELTRQIYRTSKTGEFARDFGLRDQICRAAVSIMSNIAEGFERGLHAIPAVLTPHDDLQGEETAVERRKAVFDVFPTERAFFGQFVERGSFIWIISVHTGFLQVRHSMRPSGWHTRSRAHSRPSRIARSTRAPL